MAVKNQQNRPKPHIQN
jgi:RNA polymerase II subunit A small phosphatase-like protein